jgi:ADP-ribose pyrophosphatase YjhB (NUDIX family)
MRRVLPHRRLCTTFDLVHRDRRWTISVGYFDRAEHEPAEVFIDGPKVGSELEASSRDSAVLFSIALQFGAPIDILAHALTREEDRSPSTIIGAIADRLSDVGSAP